MKEGERCLAEEVNAMQQEEKIQKQFQEAIDCYNAFLEYSTPKNIDILLSKAKDMSMLWISGVLNAGEKEEEIWEKIVSQAAEYGKISILHRKIVSAILTFCEDLSRVKMEDKQNPLPAKAGDTLIYNNTKMTVISCDSSLCVTNKGVYATDKVFTTFTLPDNRMQYYINSCTEEAVTAAYRAVKNLFLNYQNMIPPLNSENWEKLKPLTMAKDELFKNSILSAAACFLKNVNNGYLNWSDCVIIPNNSILFYIDAKNGCTNHVLVIAECDDTITLDGLGTFKKDLIGKKLFFTEAEANWYKENKLIK